MSERRPWLIAYDIAGKARLARLHYRLRKRALFVQESVAVLRASSAELDALLDTLRAQCFDERADDLRVYRIDWPDGAWLSGPDARGHLLLPAHAPPPSDDARRRPPGRPRGGHARSGARPSAAPATSAPASVGDSALAWMRQLLGGRRGRR